MTSFKSINHVAIIVSDLKKAVDFYVKKLGLKEISRIKRQEKSDIIYLDGGNAVVELFVEPKSPERLSYPEALGLRHLAFGTDSFDEKINELKNKKIEIEPIRTDLRTGKRMTFCKDPDGLPIEISEV